MERSLNKSNLRESNNEFNNTLNKSRTSSDKKVRFDESFISTASNKENYINERTLKSEKKTTNKSINKSTNKKINNFNLNNTNEIKGSKNTKMRL